jgi:hypothetical protein
MTLKRTDSFFMVGCKCPPGSEDLSGPVVFATVEGVTVFHLRNQNVIGSGINTDSAVGDGEGAAGGTF